MIAFQAGLQLRHTRPHDSTSISDSGTIGIDEARVLSEQRGRQEKNKASEGMLHGGQG